MRDAVRNRIESHREMLRHYDHPLLMLQHLIWHEGYHHGQIKLTLKMAGRAIRGQGDRSADVERVDEEGQEGIEGFHPRATEGTESSEPVPPERTAARGGKRHGDDDSPRASCLRRHGGYTSTSRYPPTALFGGLEVVEIKGRVRAPDRAPEEQPDSIEVEITSHGADRNTVNRGDKLRRGDPNLEQVPTVRPRHSRGRFSNAGATPHVMSRIPVGNIDLPVNVRIRGVCEAES